MFRRSLSSLGIALAGAALAASAVGAMFLVGALLFAVLVVGVSWLGLRALWDADDDDGGGDDGGGGRRRPRPGPGGIDIGAEPVGAWLRGAIRLVRRRTRT
ncbi:MAG: hypothetical protein IRZ00_14550 [Gemmatimonadetes bacterium]|nr:hypothetical protein [Gemmatimonadota bacterium]